ncbi:SBDS protein C-terminal domain-containing protein [Mycena filopes]|nr:SBDS protein C-terminal domain-containing protein [Mycena filopes]
MAPPLKTGATLKQRLAALSIAQSSPASGPPSPSSFRRKFTVPWARKQSSDDCAPQNGRDNVEEVMSRMIFQAGVDFETRPMVVLNASALPDPKEVNYDLLLARILAYLNLYVESDYAVVFFAAGGRHTPGWNWVWKAYRSLSRKYRKNLKRLYIVHSSFFSKMLFSLAGAIISPKFFRKLTYITTLSELACHIPLTQIDVPPTVYQENLKYETKITLPVTTRGDTHIFGVPLEDLMGFDGEKGGIPRVVRDAIQFIRESGMEEEGLFRRSPQSVMLRAAQDAYDRGNVVSLDTFGDPHLAAVLLKKYLRDLPEPIIPENLYPVVRRCPMPSSSADTTDPANLPPCVYILLSHVLHLMHDVSLRVASNRMDAHNLTVVLCPNLVGSKTNPARDVMMCSVPGGPALFTRSPAELASASNPAALAEGKTTLGTVVKLCIQRYFEIFDELRDRTEAQPPRGSAYGESSASSSASFLLQQLPCIFTAPAKWSNNSTYRPRHRSTLSGASSTMAQGTRSMMTGGGGGGGGVYGSSRHAVARERREGVAVGGDGDRRPEGAQFRLTNVSIVRLKKGGKRFEISNVFTNVSKESIRQDGDCRDRQEILKKGEVQVGEKERDHDLTALRKEIATLVAEKCEDPATQRPYPVGMIEKAMAEAGFSVKQDKTAKSQVSACIKQLQSDSTLPIQRSRMRIRVTMPTADGKRLREKVIEGAEKVEDDEMGEEEWKVIMLIDPGQFRVINDLLQKAVQRTWTAGDHDAVS